MKSENLATISALYEALGRENVATMFAAFDPQGVICQTDELPWGGLYQGCEGLKAFLTKLRDAIDSQVEVQESFAAGNRVVVIGRTRGQVRENGARFDVRAVHIYTLEGSKVTRFEAYIDTPEMQKALAGN